MSAQHTTLTFEADGRHFAAVTHATVANSRILRGLADKKSALNAASAFTYTVRRFMRAGDGSDPRTPPTEAEVAEAMYALRALIAKATRSAS